MNVKLKAAAIFLCITLSACGGGGGGGSSPAGTASSTSTTTPTSSSATGTGVPASVTTDTGGGSLAPPSPDPVAVTPPVVVTPSTPPADIALSARFSYPDGIAVHPDGTVYISEFGNHTIRKYEPVSGRVTTVAGIAGVGGAIDGAAGVGTFESPGDLAVDLNHDLYVIDRHAIRKVEHATGRITTVAGKWDVLGYAEGNGPDARFWYPSGIAIDPAHNLIVSDRINNLIRKISPAGVVSTIAGDPSKVHVNGGFIQPDTTVFEGTVATARFNQPYGLRIDSQGAIYVVNSGNQGSVMKLNPDGTASYLIKDLSMVFPTHIALDGNGGVYLIESFGYPPHASPDWKTTGVVHKVAADGTLTTIAGKPRDGGSADGAGPNASFMIPFGIAMRSDGSLYVVDSGNQTIRLVTQAGVVTTILGKTGEAAYRDAP
jgi:sugar lactone lactonase YvrE